MKRIENHELELFATKTLIDTCALARLTGTSKSYWEKMRMRKEGPRHIAAKGLVRYRWSDVEAWMNAHEVSAQEGS
jgi:predicted DNA-binding transcriptional regulator AlpA